MTSPFEIRATRDSEHSALNALYRVTFPDEELWPLVQELLALPVPTVMSLTAFRDDTELLGHICFTKCTVQDSDCSVALLGPLAVAPPVQRSGVGTALIRGGLRRLEVDGVGCVCVLGDPNYYKRVGFEADGGIRPPFELPDAWSDAWRTLALGGNDASCRGKLVVPRPWRDPSLWSP